MSRCRPESLRGAAWLRGIGAAAMAAEDLRRQRRRPHVDPALPAPRGRGGTSRVRRRTYAVANQPVSVLVTSVPASRAAASNASLAFSTSAREFRVAGAGGGGGVDLVADGELGVRRSDAFDGSCRRGGSHRAPCRRADDLPSEVAVAAVRAVRSWRPVPVRQIVHAPRLSLRVFLCIGGWLAVVRDAGEAP
jgi:hypothetical protein